MAEIREFDFCLGGISLTATSVYQDGEALLGSLHGFAGKPGFGLMVGGFVTVFVFYRLFGRQVLWRAIIGDGYMPVVKTRWRRAPCSSGTP